jgi:2-C-methyl-D-erythritol 2,4-cyclodiphosphate synthase
MRVGHGFDVHALVPGRPLIIGGVHIEHDKGLMGHSDADVLIHAICDACLGALAAGDLGQLYPDTDERFQGVDSRELLRDVYRLVNDHNNRIVNVDSTVIAQHPKLAPYIPKMRLLIADDLCIEQNQISIKATTTENLGYLGRDEGVAAHAVVLLDENEKL